MNSEDKADTSKRRYAFAAIVTLTLVIAASALVATEKRGSSFPEERLQKVEDILAIQQLLGDYMTYMDASDYASYSDLFAGDGELIFQRYHLTGPKAIRELMEQGSRNAVASRPAGAPGGLRHMMSNIVIRISGNQATDTARWIVMSPGADGRPVIGATGHYDDLLRKDGAQWKFKRRVIYADFPYDNPLAGSR
jgi:ketosteroid isomerase-like protein